MKDAPARPLATPSPTACPACGAAVDALRAGEVAILEGGFRYFCDRGCKAAFLETSSRREVHEAMTMEPPAVSAVVPTSHQARTAAFEIPAPARIPDIALLAAPATQRTPFFPPAGPREQQGAVDVSERGAVVVSDHGALEPVEPGAIDASEPGTNASEPVEPVEPVEPGAEVAERGAAERLDSDPAFANATVEVATPLPLSAGPAAARRRAATQPTTSAPAQPPRSRPAAYPLPIARRWLAALGSLGPYVGMAAGVGAAVVPLAGATAARGRLPLALVATAVALSVAWRGAASRGVRQSGAVVLALPLGLAAVGAVVSRAVGSSHAAAHALFVAATAAAWLAVEVLVARSRRDVLEQRARIQAALSLAVTRVDIDTVTLVDAEAIRTGDTIRVSAGETVGVDGVIVAGQGEVAPWLDAQVVAKKREGDPVVAGALLLSGSLDVVATFSGHDRTWLRQSRPSQTMEETAPLVEFGQRLALRGAPIAAVLVGGATYANNGNLSDVLMAACAGAFGLSVASSLALAGLAEARGNLAARRRGIVFKDANTFDVAARADVAVVCSRGTILLGEPEIVAIESVGGGAVRPDAAARVLSLAAGAEVSSDHPFAAAILRAARARGVRPETARSALVHSGLGVTALAPDGEKIIVGSRSLLLKEKVSVALADARVSELEAQGRSVLLVSLGSKLIGLLALQDGLRPGARAAVQRLHDARIEPVLLSGEARDTCETIARALDVEHVRPEILPQDRGAEVRALADGGHVVATIGHALSDDGALGAADVSIAMQAAGTTPGEWGVLLASDDVRDAALALTIPRLARDKARNATIAGAAVHAVASLAVAFGIAPPLVVPVVAVLVTAVVLSMVRDSSDR